VENKPKPESKEVEEDKPPVFSSWKGWYGLVLGALITYIILLYLFTNLY
jgi:hypothetical protein